MYGFYSKSKYHNKKTEQDGHLFDSKKEAARYSELKMLALAGEISGLEMQKRFLIVPKEGNNTRARHYVADFVYTDKQGRKVIEDVKSPITKKNPVYTLKKALMLYLYPEYLFIET